MRAKLNAGVTMETVWGVKWPIPSSFELIIILLVFLLVMLFLVLFRYNLYFKRQKMHAQQLFLFKTKQLGLTNFQIKILNGLANMLKLKDTINLLRNPELFESSLGKFLSFLREQEEEEESLHSISIDIIKTYEKLYHPESYKKPLDRIQDLEVDILICFFVEEGDVYIGRILEKDDKSMTLKIFGSSIALHEFMDFPIKIYLWRKGDAEYTFNSKIINIENEMITIELPEEFIRGEEVRHPYIDTIIPCTVSDLLLTEETKKKDESEKINGTIYKVNEFEAVLRLSSKLDYEKSYSLEFELTGFKMNITSKVISDRTITEEKISYYTFRFIDMSEPARNILLRYIKERL
jgi:hypothetical protein